MWSQLFRLPLSSAHAYSESMKLRLLFLVLLLLLAFAALACSGDSDDDPTAVAPPTTLGTPDSASPTSAPSPTATLGVAPAATPTPPADAEGQAKALRLIEAPQGMLEFTTDGPYVVPGDALGMFYLNIETQQIEGWYDLLGGTTPYASSGDARFTAFRRGQQVFQGGQTYPAGFYIGDRETQTVYHVEGDAQPVFQRSQNGAYEIASRGDLLLFQIPVDDGDDWFAVFDMATGKVKTTFQVEARLALFSGDGATIALANWGASPHVYLADVASGDVRDIGEIALDDTDLEGEVALLNSGDGAAFTFVANPAKAQYTGIATRFSWQGNQLSELKGDELLVSPYGDYVAVMEPMGSAASDAPSPWVVFTGYNLADLSPTFRVSGVSPYLGRSTGNRWLVDGSGFAVEQADGKLVLAMRSGELRDYPGVPSPSDPNVFAINGGAGGSVGAVTADGKPIVSISFQGGVRDFVDPWGDNGNEIRMLIPHGGHDGPPITASIAQPFVEQAPYAGEPQLQLTDVGVAFGLTNLYDQPGSQTVVGQIAAPYRVTVQEVAWHCSGNTGLDPSQCQRIDSNVAHEFMALVLGSEIGPDAPTSSYWARVTTPDGQSGWILLQANIQGI
jgi:hypothetical protein